MPEASRFRRIERWYDNKYVILRKMKQLSKDKMCNVYALCTAPVLIFFSFVVVLSYAKNLSMIFFSFLFAWIGVAVGSEPWCYFSLLLSLIISYFVGIFSICERQNVRCEIQRYDVIKSFRITIQNRFVRWLHDKYQGHFTFGQASSIQCTVANRMNKTKTKFIGEDKP